LASFVVNNLAAFGGVKPFGDEAWKYSPFCNNLLEFNHTMPSRLT